METEQTEALHKDGLLHEAEARPHVSMTTKKAALLLSLTRRSVSKACLMGSLPGAKKFGRDWCVPESAISYYLAHHKGQRGRKKKK